MLSVEHVPFLHIRHTISQKPSAANIALAMTHTLQHDDVPVLWDLRDMECDEDFWTDLPDKITSQAKELFPKMSAMKRGFVVGDETVKRGLETFLTRLRPPWPWAVFRELNHALDWLEQNEGER